MRVEDMINDIVKKSYNIFKNNYVVLVIGTIIALLGMIFIITIPPLIFGIYIVCLRLLKGKKIEIFDVFKGFNYFFTSWGLFIVAFLAILGGLILLIIPGLILIVLFQYIIVIALIEKKGIIDTLKRSYALGKENFNFSIMFGILMAVISGLGSLTKIGMLVTIPFTALCTCIATQKLIKKSKTR